MKKAKIYAVLQILLFPIIFLSFRRCISLFQTSIFDCLIGILIAIGLSVVFFRLQKAKKASLNITTNISELEKEKSILIKKISSLKKEIKTLKNP